MNTTRQPQPSQPSNDAIEASSRSSRSVGVSSWTKTRIGVLATLLIGALLGSAGNAYADEKKDDEKTVRSRKAKMADKAMNAITQYISSVSYCQNCGEQGDDPPRWVTPEGAVSARDLTIWFLDTPAFSEGAGGGPVDQELDFEYSLSLAFDGGGVASMTGVGITKLAGAATGTSDQLLFELEVQSFDLGGQLTSGQNLLVRESPTQRSIAITSVESQGEAMFWTESEIDLSLELSFDGGASWTSASPSVPEPSGLFAIGSAIALAAARRGSRASCAPQRGGFGITSRSDRKQPPGKRRVPR